MKISYKFLFLMAVCTSQAMLEYEFGMYLLRPGSTSHDYHEVSNKVARDKSIVAGSDHALDMWLMKSICTRLRRVDSLCWAVSNSEGYEQCFRLFSKFVNKYSMKVHGRLEYQSYFSSQLLNLLNIQSIENIHQIMELARAEVNQPPVPSLVSSLWLEVRHGLVEQKAHAIHLTQSGLRDASDSRNEAIDDLRVMSCILNTLCNFTDLDTSWKSQRLLENLGRGQQLEPDAYTKFDEICIAFILSGGSIHLDSIRSCLSTNMKKLMRKAGISFELQEFNAERMELVKSADIDMFSESSSYSAGSTDETETLGGGS